MKFRILFYSCCSIIAIFLISIIAISVKSKEDEQRILLQKVMSVCDSKIKDIELIYHDVALKKDVSVVMNRIEDIEYLCTALKGVEDIYFSKARDVFRVRVVINYYDGGAFVMAGRIRYKNNLFLSESGWEHISVRIEGLGAWLLSKINLYQLK